MDTNLEIWKDIFGYEGIYQISSFGRIKSLSRIVNRGSRICSVKERIRKITIAKYTRYPHIVLCKDGENKNENYHRLIALAFIPNPDNKKEVNHKDGNKLNNSIENLEWMTPKENINHGNKLGLMRYPGMKNPLKGSKNPMAILNETKVKKIKKLLLINVNLNVIANKFNVSTGVIYHIARGRSWRHIILSFFIIIPFFCYSQETVTIPLFVADSLESAYQRSIEYQKLAAEYLDLALLWQHKSQGISAALQDKVAEIATMKELQGIDLGEFKREKASLQQQVKDERKLKNRWKWGFWGVVVAAGYIIGKTN